MKTMLLLSAALLTFQPRLLAQSCLDKIVTVHWKKATFAEVLAELEAVSGCTFSYGSANITPHANVSFSGNRVSVASALRSVLGADLDFRDIRNNIVIYPSNKVQKKFTLYGYVKDSLSGETLAGAHVQVPSTAFAVSANEYGFYSLTLPEGEHTVTCSFVGNKTVTKNLVLEKDHELYFSLLPDVRTLGEVEVTAEEDGAHGRHAGTGTQVLNAAIIRSKAVLAGEPDLLKTIQLLPGVKTLGEGSSGYFVRGGSMDQNLILLDEAPVYNPAHLLGFFSAFQADAIRDVTFYTSDIPAMYGGRLSSLADIRIRDGNDKHWVSTGGIGLISARMTVEGPLAKERSSILVSGRRTYGDLFLPLVGNADITDTDLNFYDLHVKLNYRFSPKDRIYLSAFSGRDLFRKQSELRINWGNQTSTFRWNHRFNERAFSNVSILRSHYFYKLGIEQDHQIMSSWNADIRDLALKADFSLFTKNNDLLRIGMSSVYHKFQPARYYDNGDKATDALPPAHALEHALYVAREQSLSENIFVEYGLRLSLFQNMGRGVSHIYDNNHQLVRTIQHDRGEIFHSYHGLEPRANIRYQVSAHRAFKLSYTRMYQYIQQLSNYTTSFSAPDLWIQANPAIQPQMADQVALGYSDMKNCSGQLLHYSIEGYYKHLSNQVDYEDHAALALNPHVEGMLRSGRAWAYGLEWMLKKTTGRVTGSVHYTWSRAIRQIDEINHGKSYPARYDRPHATNVAASVLLAPMEGGCQLDIRLGEAVTSPVGSYTYKGLQVPIYSERNARRYPPYHRLDLSATLTPARARKYERSWTFALYNAYYRKNTFALNYNRTVDNFGNIIPDPFGMEPPIFGSRRATTKTFLFAIVPSVSYNFKF